VGVVRRVSTLGRGLVFGGVVFVVFACGGIDDDELHCEEAVSHLEDCCEGFEARRFNCEEQTDCTFNDRHPDFYDSASQCIRDRSCDQLREQGKCAAFVKIANEAYPSEDPTRIETEACK
jgi:hypothetical protein